MTYKTYNDVNPLPNDILVINIDNGERTTKGGIYITSDDYISDGERGIRPRWGQVYKVGTNIDYVTPNQWILMENGRWSRGIDVELEDKSFYFHKIDVNSILLVSDTKPSDIK